MARIARITAPGFPHHVIQRGNRRQKTFFCDVDYEEYLRFLKLYSEKFGTEILAYCLMPNHVHLIAIPSSEDSLAGAIGQTHLKYTRMINLRKKWRGYLWQGRFSSYILDEKYLLTAIKYILLNPVKAGMVKDPFSYRWSSARQHLDIDKSGFLSNNPINNIVDDWKEFLGSNVHKNDVNLLKLHERTGRPLANNAIIEKLEKTLDRSLKKRKPGPKGKNNN